MNQNRNRDMSVNMNKATNRPSNRIGNINIREKIENESKYNC